VAFVTVPTLAADITKISKEELKSMLGNPDVIILDVNPERRWKAADRKILGAFREDPKDVESWMNKYTMDKTLVLYCA
jgi:predicted sulfurtransferase